MGGFVLLGIGLLLIFHAVRLSHGKRVFELQIETEQQVFRGIEAIGPAFPLIEAMNGAPPSSEVFRGWFQQMHGVLLSLPTLPFPWTSSQIRMISRLDHDYKKYFEQSSSAGIWTDPALSETIRKIATTRQALLHSVERTTTTLGQRSRALGKELDRTGFEIFGVGIAAFGLFSFSLLTHRSTQKFLKKLAVSETYLTALIEAVPIALFLKDVEGRWLKVNKTGLDLFGVAGKDWKNRTDLELAQELPFYQEALETCRSRDLDAWDHGGATRAIEQVPRQDGTLVSFETMKIPLRNPDGSPLGLVVSAYDLTERLRYEEAMELYRRIFENTREGIMITDSDQRIIDINPAFSRVTEYSREEALGESPRFLNSGHQTEEFYRTMWTEIEIRGYWEGEIWNRKKSGEIYCEWLEIAILKKEGQPVRYIGIFSDITKRKEDEERIVHLAFHDPLTGLSNRRTFKKKIEEEISRLEREPEHSFSVGILDLDGFKEVNDRLGHPAGDDLLVQVSRRLEETLRNTDVLARLGGDEFGLLFLKTGHEEIIFDRIIKALSTPFDVGGERVTISGSMGMTFCPPDRAEADLLLSHADLALYRVKNRGRNGWVPFHQEMEKGLAIRHRIRVELEQALANRELLLNFQPQVNMTTGQVIGVEALVRWAHPVRGLLFPDSFIKVAEEGDLVAPLGRFVLKEALVHQDRWRRLGIELRVSVNIGAWHFLSEAFLTDLETAVALHCRAGLCPVTLELEVTETEALRDLSQAQRIVEKCRELGIVVSLDDFGTGQASLTSLQKLAIGEIKIDQGFIGKARYSAKDKAIVSSLIVAGHMMGIAVVAEGVETEEDGLLLIGMGCEIAQGYAIARPMPSEVIPEWIANWTPFESWIRKGDQMHRSTNQEPS